MLVFEQILFIIIIIIIKNKELLYKKWTLDVSVDFRQPYWCTRTVHQYGVSIKKLYKGGLNVSANNSEAVGNKNLRLGQIVYILVF